MNFTGMMQYYNEEVTYLGLIYTSDDYRHDLCNLTTSKNTRHFQGGCARCTWRQVEETTQDRNKRRALFDGLCT